MLLLPLAIALQERFVLWSIANELNTAEDFIHYLDDIYGRTKINHKTIDDALEVWQAWESQGMAKPYNMADIAADPFGTYYAYFQDILTACDIDEFDSKLVYFSLIRINNLNAYASTMPNTDKVIVFDEHLISFFTTFIVTVMVSVYSAASAEELDRLDELIISNLAIFHSKDSTQTTQQKKQAFTDNFKKIIKQNYKLTEIGCYFSIAFTVFIICHELSHHLLGHAEQKRMHVVTETTVDHEYDDMIMHGKQDKQHDPKAIPLNTPAYQEEFEADKYGYQLFLQLIDKVDDVQSAKLSPAFNRAPLIFFEMLEIVRLSIPQADNHKFDSDTHPPPIERKNYLLTHYEDKLHPDGIKLYQGFMQFATRIKQKLRAVTDPLA